MAFVVLFTLSLKLVEDSAPANVKTYLQVGGEVVAIVNARNYVILVEYSLKLVVRVIGIPLFVLGTKPFKEQKSFSHKSVKGVNV